MPVYQSQVVGEQRRREHKKKGPQQNVDTKGCTKILNHCLTTKAIRNKPTAFALLARNRVRFMALLPLTHGPLRDPEPLSDRATLSRPGVDKGPGTTETLVFDELAKEVLWH